MPMKQKSTLRPGREAGFTLIELLVTISIIGILAALAVQNFAELRRKGFDSRVQTDLHNIATAEEAYFTDYQTYKSCTSAATCSSAMPSIRAFSPGVTLQVTATTSGFIATGTHPQGGGRIFTWDSLAGGMQ